MAHRTWLSRIKMWWSLPQIPLEIPPLEITIHPESAPPPADLEEALKRAVRKIHLRLRAVSSSRALFNKIVFNKQKLYVVKALEYFSERRVIRFLWIEGVPSFPKDIAGYWGEHNTLFICMFKNRLRNVGSYTLNGISKKEFLAHFKNYLEQFILETLIAGIWRQETEKPINERIKHDIHFAAYLLFPVDISHFNNIHFSIEPSVSGN